MRDDLRDARSKAGLTQSQLGELIGRDQGTVSRIETGNSDVDKDLAPLIAKALGIDILAVLYPPPPTKARTRHAA